MQWCPAHGREEAPVFLLELLHQATGAVVRLIDESVLDFTRSAFWYNRVGASVFLGSHTTTAGYHLSGQCYQGMWSAEALTCWTAPPFTANFTTIWAQPWQMGRTGHAIKKEGSKSLHRGSAVPVPFGGHKGTQRPSGVGIDLGRCQFNFSRVRNKVEPFRYYQFIQGTSRA